MKITFIGLGIMGSRMATHLLKNGTDLTVYNRSAKPMEDLAFLGAKTTASIDEAVENADIVFTMLSRPEVVESLMIEQGLASMKKNSLWIDCSTVDPAFTHKAHEAAKNQHILYMEAPVAGTKPQAEAGELVFFVGGEAHLLEKVEPFLKAMGSKVLHLGEVGKGASFKLVVNMMLGINMIAFSESVKLGETLGLDKNFLLDTIPNLPVSAPFLKSKAALVKAASYEPEFPLELLHKDMGLVKKSASERNLELSLTETAEELYQKAVRNNLGRKDMNAIHQIYEKDALS